MKGLKEFLEALKGNEGLRAEVEKVQDDAKKVVEIAKKNGYSFTEDEYMDAKMDAVSGGDKGWGEIFGDVMQKFTNSSQDGINQGQQGVPQGFTAVKLTNGITTYINNNDGSSWMVDASCQGGYRRL